ncbi:hypothetical protein [Rudaea sp.]|uniref:hypothetical protein n=1 Tax=Rudaea sp. TaxID=2136325 RepID=UPI003784BBA4
MANASVAIPVPPHAVEDELRQLRATYQFFYFKVTEMDMPHDKEYPNGLFGEHPEITFGLMEAIYNNIERLHDAFHGAEKGA